MWAAHSVNLDCGEAASEIDGLADTKSTTKIKPIAFCGQRFVPARRSQAETRSNNSRSPL